MNNKESITIFFVKLSIFFPKYEASFDAHIDPKMFVFLFGRIRCSLWWSGEKSKDRQNG